MPLQERVRLDPIARKKITTLLRQFYEHLRSQEIPARIADFFERHGRPEPRGSADVPSQQGTRR